MTGVIEYKQMIFIRKDLKMRAGKMCVQSSRACDEIQTAYRNRTTEAGVNIMETWLNDGINKKIAVYVADLNEMQECLDIAVENNWTYSIVQDIGMTEFKGVLTTTCLVVGPAPSDRLDVYYRHLKTC